MSTSLSSLADNLSEINKKVSTDEFINRKELGEKFFNIYRFRNRHPNKFSLLLRKGVYPYEYMDSWEKFNETELPDKESFYSELNKEGITDEDYAHALKVWNTFNIKNLGEYHDLYVQSDTLFLADVFENFRDSCINTYELDPAHFVSLPGLVWHTCLKKTGIELEILTDNDMLLMEEKRIRRGMCNAIHKYAKANNKYMKDIDKNKISSFLEYLDANNLYGWAMSQKIPVGDFKWIKKRDLPKTDKKFIKSYDVDSNVGFVLEVDVDYPKKLHKLHSDLPFLPQREVINKCSKLINTLRNKKKYVIHIRALKQALNQGLILKKVHRVIKFRQEAWLKPYIGMNTNLRTSAKNDFEKDFFKKMNNAVFCKTMQNDRKYRDIKIVTTNKQRMKFASEPNYHTTKQISEDLLIMEMKKISVTMNKPIYLGQSILDISKTLMYEF